MSEFIRLSDIELSKLRGKVAINRYAKCLLDSPIFSDLKLDSKELIYDSRSLSAILSDKEREILSHYTGFGGKLSDLLEKGHGGEIYEFYTPDYLCKLMWDIAFYYGFNRKGNVLEPSCGNGNLIKYAPDKSKVAAFEINTDSARVAKLLYNATVYPYEFERAFLEGNMWNKPIKGKTTWLPQYPFSLIIGNPPYGVHTGYYRAFFKKNYKRVEFFFIQKGLELLENEGIMVFLVPSLFMMNGDKYQGTKQEIAKVADLVDAYRVGSVFDNSKVMADILVFQKKQIPNTVHTFDLMADDNFFKKYPQKLAGTYEKTTSLHFPIIMKVSQEQVENMINGAINTNTEQKMTILNYNKEKNGIEVAFSNRPEDTIILWLKENGFKWSKFNKLWYKSYTERDFEDAKAYIFEKEETNENIISNEYRDLDGLIEKYSALLTEQVKHEYNEINISVRVEEIKSDFKIKIKSFISYIDRKVYAEILRYIEPKNNYLFRSLFEEYTGVDLGETKNSWNKVLSLFVTGKTVIKKEAKKEIREVKKEHDDSERYEVESESTHLHLVRVRLKLAKAKLNLALMKKSNS